MPEAVRSELNDGARERVCHPAGVELRFVADGAAEITLSSDGRESPVQVFWGPFQERGVRTVGNEPRTLRLSVPDDLRALDPEAVADSPFDPRVCRLRLAGEHRGGRVFYHGVDGDVRPPRADELPDRRYLAYGTSITEGEAATAEHLTYVQRTAELLGADCLNLGTCGSAYCGPAMAEYVARRDDWDVATLALSVNMVDEFSPAAFRDRAAAMIETVAGARPDRPVACVTLFPHYRDVRGDADERELSERFREILREIVAATSRENVHLFEGPELLGGVEGLTADLIHPGDDAMGRIAANLAPRLRSLLGDASGSIDGQ